MIKTWQQRCEEHPAHDGIVTTQMIQKRMQEEIDELRAAIEQAEKQEPHSLLCVCGAEWDIYPDGKEVLASTAPRQWQRLTEQEIKDCEKQAMVNGSLPFEQRSLFARAIEAKLKEKNT